MNSKIIDQFGRKHDYLRISLTERCNLRCVYCMPEDGIELSEKESLMTHEEVISIAKKFVDMGVRKIRLTGGEPLIKKNIEKIIIELTKLPINLGITTNGILLDNYLELFKKSGVKDINISLDTLKREKFNSITRRDYFDRVINNINLYEQNGFNIKINNVLIKGMNEDEMLDFIEFTKNKNVIAIPRKALVGSVKNPEVFIVDNKIAKIRKVVIGTESGTEVQVINGVNVGEIIVVNGQNNLEDNTKVEILNK